jgi:hypothetical protein
VLIALDGIRPGERARLNRLPINPHEPELAGPDGSGSSNLTFQWDALLVWVEWVEFLKLASNGITGGEAELRKAPEIT